MTTEEMRRVDKMLIKRGHHAAWAAGDTAHMVPTADYTAIEIDPEQGDHYLRHGQQEEYPRQKRGENERPH